MSKFVKLALVGLVLAACDQDVILPGERFAVRTPLADSVPVEGQPAPVDAPAQPLNEARAIGLPAMVSNAEWTERGGSATHNGPHGQLSAQPALAWSVKIGAGNSRRNRITAAPVVAGGAVFAMDALTHVSAVSLAGGLLWQADITAAFDRGGQQSGGGLAVGGGRVFATTGYGEVVALDASTGGVLWRHRMGSPASGAPGLGGGKVFVMSVDGTGWALDAASGKEMWTLPAAENLLGSDTGASPAVTGANVIFPFAVGVMAASQRETGASLWQAAITGNRLGRAYANSGVITGDPVVTGGVVYVGTQAGRTGAFREDTGEMLWTAEEGAVNPPLVVGGSVFVVNDEDKLIRLDASTGARIWAVPMPYFTASRPKRYAQIYTHFGPVLAGGRLVTVSSDGLIRQFDPATGAVVGQTALPGGAAASPALAAGMMFIVNGQGQLLAFR